ncbi:ABC transporter ATP-binding protein [Bacillus sp. GM2]|jgi:ATP-binding cassette subfamily B multidrug efflux pump|uniref:ABC transporter n=1 Tax=Bacillus licheniformis (strain ATCC 14580 / DSM 13 / JCM 2505 / CCUG 7422 / NBRC 12200 / NCIMB 9375 / NCTC 10341 / NRRL NRS-1264 / Gibson 46) TaxID=279010 RepID=Q65K71_BACLD|nr:MULTISPECIES: ABC transporter ATP-binding protein [Bacillus]AAU23185.1 ABC transporter [Bacillus licheniformis DSM 13 = ATCC 14580]AAU40543.1 antimicrobial peptide ABC transporter ATP-binding protein YknU [Bacillus licheniformis DSM 13 = ATCC 14580]AOP14748.1 Lipid A export ATP-binding/permease protein MsbA [Bacillus licheniformis]ARC65813.1 putative multidrug resistance ABC transporter ATP-binding/permease protein YheI [Bacillus licheniformis]ARC72059.1 putative multidrug resistance ABC tr
MESLKKLKDFYWPYKKMFLWSIASMLLMTAITVVYPIILQMTIDEVILGGKYGLVIWISLGFIAVMAAKGAATFFHQYLGDMFGIRSVYRLRKELYAKLQRLPFKYYDSAKTGDLMSRLTADVEGIRFFLSFGFAEAIRFILLVTFSLSVMFSYSVPLTLVTIASLPFLGAAVYRFDKKVHPAFRNIRKSFARLNTKVQENISGMNTVKSLSKEDFEIQNFTHSNDHFRTKNLNASFIMSKFFPLMEFIGNICLVALLSFGGWLVMQNSLKPGELVAFFSLVNYLMWPIMNLGYVINLFSQAKASGERLLEILDAEEEITDTEQAVKSGRLNGDVAFSDVSLQYTKENAEALHGVSFQAERGKTIGLIGATGSGKSSIIQLLSRFYEPTSGRITIDGKPLEHYSLKMLRSNIGVVPQESFLFSSTIRSNISYGKPDASMDEIIESAKRAQAHDFIMELPNQYDTMLGERGLGLSGGQKQRIAIARAICMNPGILILDDSTSAVDMETEHRIQLALREVMRDRTTFIIAHRISSLKHADEILVLDKGVVKERGTHEQLMEANGLYKRIFDLQYKDQNVLNEPHFAG